MTVALAIPLAAMRYDDLPLKAILGILFFASLSAVALPMGLAYALHMSSADIMAFATRAVTTPIAINIATLLEAPIQLAVLIVILSGVVGAAFSPLILRHINDERASGLAFRSELHMPLVLLKHGNVAVLQDVMLPLAWQSMQSLPQFGCQHLYCIYKECD